MDGQQWDDAGLDGSMAQATLLAIDPLHGSDQPGEVKLPAGEDFLRADFQRAGPDLLVETPSGSTFVVADYFMAETAPSLMTAGGQMLTGTMVSALAGPAAPGQVAQVAMDGVDTGSAQSGITQGASIGQVSEVEGTVTVTRADGTQAQLVTGDPIFQGDVIETGSGADVAVVFIDDTIFTLAEDGRMVMDEMVYDPGAQTGTFNAEVVQGVFSFVSGQIAKTSPDGMVVQTPTSTIGIRGSTVTGDGTTITLVRDVDGNVGEIIISNAAGTVVLNQANAATFIESFNAAPAQPTILSQQAIQARFGSSLTKLTKVVADKAQADAQRASQEAEQKASKADEAKKAETEATEAKSEAEQKLADAQASGDPDAIQEAEAELKAAQDAEAEAKAQAEAAEAEALAAQEQAQQAQQFQAVAQTAFTQQAQAFEQVQQQQQNNDPNQNPTPTDPVVIQVQDSNTQNDPNNNPEQNNDPNKQQKDPLKPDDQKLLGDKPLNNEDNPPPNTAPDKIDLKFSGAEDSVISGKVAVTDPEGHAVTYAPKGGAAHGTLFVSTDGGFRYTPDANFNGTDSFIVVAKDALGLTSESTVTLNVTPVNDAPSVSISNVSAGNAPPGSAGLGFDGSNDYVEISETTLNNQPSGTIEAWVYVDHFETAGLVTSRQHDFADTTAAFGIGGATATDSATAVTTQGVLSWHADNAAGTVTSTGTIQAGQWQHVAVTFTATQVKFYINGSLDTTINGDYSVPNDTTNNAYTPHATIGGQFKLGSLYNAFNGRIADLRMWNVERSAGQIADFANAALNGDETGLVGYWQLSSILNGTTADMTANNDHGVLGTATVGDSSEPTTDALYNASTVTGGTLTLTSSHLNATDVDNTDASLVYTLMGLPTNGSVKLNGTGLDISGTFTQADVNAGNVSYVQNGTAVGSDSFSFQVGDGTATTSVQTFAISISDQLTGTAGADTLTGTNGALTISGLGGDDTITGGTANDTILGGAGNDTINGGGGNDTITGGDGNDVIDGGLGTDASNLNGALADYTWSFASDGTLTLTDTVGTDGTDTLTGIETVSFTDGDVTVAQEAPERVVNTTTANTQDVPKIISLNDGGHIVVWRTDNGTNMDTVGQRYDAAGQTVGGEFTVASGTGDQFFEQYTQLQSFMDGSYAITWIEGTWGNGATYEAKATIFDESGTTVASNIALNTTTTNEQARASVTKLSNGDFVFAWQDLGQDGSNFGVYARRYQADGTPIDANEVLVNSTTTGNQYMPVVTYLDTGGYAVVWRDDSSGVTGADIKARFFDEQGVESVAEFAVASTTGGESNPKVTTLDNGNIAVAWIDLTGADPADVYVKVLDSAGQTVTNSNLDTSILVSADTTGDQGDVNVTGLENGGFVVTWVEHNGTDYDVLAQRFDANNDKVGGEISVAAAVNDQRWPTVNATYDGGFIVTWQSNEQDGTTYDIYSKRFDQDGNELGYTQLTGDANNNTFKIQPSDNLVAVDGGAGLDTLVLGGVGGDLNVVKASNVETITGGAADDIVLMGTAVTDAVSIDLGAGTDTVKLADGGNTTAAFTNVEEVIGGTGADNVLINTTFAAADNAWFDGMGGVDQLLLTTGNDVFDAENFETVNAGAGNDNWSSEWGVDLVGVTITGLETITIDNNNDGQDFLTLGNDYAFGVSINLVGSGDDIIEAGNSLDLSLANINGFAEIQIDQDGINTVGATLTLGNANLPANTPMTFTGNGDDIVTMTANATVDLTTATFNGITGLQGNNAGSETVTSYGDLDLRGITTVSQLETIQIDTDNNAASTLWVDDAVAFSLDSYGAAIALNGTGGNDNITSNGGMDLSNATTTIGINNIIVDAATGSGVQTLTLGANTYNANAIVGDGDDIIQMSATSLDLSTVGTLSGISSINGTAAADTITGTTGNDRIIGGDGADTLNGGAGADVFQYTSTALGTLDLTTGDITDAAAGDSFDFSAAVEGSMTIGGIALSALGGNTNLAAALSNAASTENSIALVDAGLGDMQLHIDTNNDAAADLTFDVSDTVTTATYDTAQGVITLA